MKKYCVLYPNTWNVNLVKEMGMMPYKLHKLYGYDSTIACYKLDEYDYLKEEVKGLKIDFIERKYNNYTLDGLRYLNKKAKDIDILQIFHVTLYSMFYAYRYKKLNPKGKIYLKLDCSYKLIDKIKALTPLKRKLLNKYLDKVDLISAEQVSLSEKLKKLLKKHENKIITIPDGVDYSYLEKNNIVYNYEEKENTILNVARIGAEEKNTPMLLEAFSKVSDAAKSGWKLKLIGPIEENFKSYIEDFFEKNPNLKGRIEIIGPIKDRRKLYDEYKKSKIFCLTSEFESFGIAFVEAAALGNVILATDVGIVREIVVKGNGGVVPLRDTKGLTLMMEKLIKDKNIQNYSKYTYDICNEKFNWDKIIQKLKRDFDKHNF
ncbi:glycosyltransferase family 4 protein [Haloimpatiens sp. FM7315]|uniref:glycosyltransferase family 4 protein n=1 Tax=Haloimpatiens sp. FM7315 TaxID=3298609 RepID=UPI0035A33076